MKYVRVQNQHKIAWGVLDGDVVRTLHCAPYVEETEYYDGKTWKVENCTFLAPCEPSKIVCIGKNYFDHVVEMGSADDVPEKPILFMKTPNCITGPDTEVTAPDFVQRMDYEGELAFVVKKQAKNVQATDVWSYILGFTCLNDITARDIQKGDGQWTRGKCMDGFSPVGPLLTDEVDPTNLRITTRLNGSVVQDSNTEKQMTKIPELFEFITASITLEAGDVVTTGTPAGVGPMKPGDVVEVEVEGIGVLRNTGI